MGPDVMDKEGSSSREEEELSDDEEDRLEERRRRFCMERRQESVPNDSGAKPIRSIKSTRLGLRTVREMKRPKNDNYNNVALNKRRRMVGYSHYDPFPKQHHHPPSGERTHHNRASNLTVVKVFKELPPQGPVIFINPTFVKKFLEKYIKLASNTATNTTTSTSFHRQPQPPQQLPTTTSTINHLSDINKGSACSSASTNTLLSASATPTTTTTNMIEPVDLFRTCPIKSLQAACTMAIIRLVTECIEDDNKRDERYNKKLVDQLLEKLRPVQ